jgi:phosphoribosyl 1,2-cyclic phosphodiesterase
MKVVVLSSGSKGNTTYVECGNTKILIDMWNTCKYVVSKLMGIGINAEDIDAIFITHTHVDHVKGLKVFLKKFGTKKSKMYNFLRIILMKG